MQSLFCFDFETTVYAGQDHTEVWSAAMAFLWQDEVNVFNSIDEFFNYLFKCKMNLRGYVHNLKFDGHFVVDWLFRKGFVHSHCKKNELKSNEFTTLIGKMGQWYSITIKKGKQIIEIWDSLKLMPFTLKEIGKAFKTKHQKLEMEYEGRRYAGCKISKEEMEYIKNDVLVLKEALEYMLKNGNEKMTIGSNCLMQLKKTIDFDMTFPDYSAMLIDEKEYGSATVHEYCEKAYVGGYCYCKKSQNRTGKGFVVDAYSLYPSQMHSSSRNKYPIGIPKFWKGDIPEKAKSENVVYFVRFKCRFQLKKNYLPTVQIKRNRLYKATEYLTTSDIFYKGKYYSYHIDLDGKREKVIVEMTMTSVNFEIFLKHYDIFDLEILDGCMFYAVEGIFDAYLEKYDKIKLNSKGAERTEAKLYMNNSYGQLAKKTDSSYKEPYFENNIVHFKLIQENNKKPVAMPAGAFVTSYARRETITAAQNNYNIFNYADTDSLHCDGELKDLQKVKIAEKGFCTWKCEAEFDSAYYVRQKTYIEHVVSENLEPVEPHWEITCAGMTEVSKKYFLKELEKGNLKIEDFDIGLEIPEDHGRLKPKRIPGGIVLKKEPFKIKPKCSSFDK